MTAAIRRVLMDYATGVGVSFKEAVRDYRALSEPDRFAFIRNLRDLEKAHQKYLETGELPERAPLLFGPDGSPIE